MLGHCAVLPKAHKTDGNGTDLAGAMFRAVNDDNPSIVYEIGPTDGYGNAETGVNAVLYGSYTITEYVFPVNFQSGSQTSWHVTLEDANAGAVTFEAVNDIKRGSIRVHKTSDSGRNLAGAVFEAVKTDEPYKGTRYTIGPTLTDGTAGVDGVYYGTYSIVETLFPDWHTSGAISKWTVAVDDGTGGVATFEASNAYHPMLHIEKSGEEPADYAGRVFDVYDGGNIVLTLVTDEEGKASGRLPHYGQYSIRERDTAGYTVTYEGLPFTDYFFTYSADTGDNLTLHITDTKKDGKLQIKKTSDDGVVAGFKFKVTDKNGKEYFGETDYTGYLTTKAYPVFYTDWRDRSLIMMVEWGMTVKDVKALLATRVDDISAYDVVGWLGDEPPTEDNKNYVLPDEEDVSICVGWAYPDIVERATGQIYARITVRGRGGTHKSIDPPGGDTDTYYYEQYLLKDGSMIAETREINGVPKTDFPVCRYIDDYHLEVGNNLYHICEFAELYERNHTTVRPYLPEEPDREKRYAEPER